MKSFIKNNQSFICINCSADVPQHPSSSRDHCNVCLYSLHVDINPGDRLNSCKGKLIPIGIINKNNKTKIIYQCSKCGETTNNITAPDDSFDVILKLSSIPVREI